MATRVRSYSKINLGLAVGLPRADGYHPLTTLYQTLALHDVVTVTARAGRETAITLSADHPWVPRTDAGTAEKNTAFRIVEGWMDVMGFTAKVHIDIKKRLPVQGGMGAGSANAAAAMLGLEKELGTAMPQDKRLELAAKIGSDVPLFLVGGAVLGTGRGEIVAAMRDFAPTACVIAVPGVGVSTPQAFRDLDARMEDARMEAASELTKTASVDKLEMLSRALVDVLGNPEGDPEAIGKEPGPSGIFRTARPDNSLDTGTSGDLAENTLLALVRTGIENDFEEVAFSQHPFLRDLKRQLMGDSESKAVYAALSGSGSALFGLYVTQADAVAAQHRVQSTGTQAILTETLPRPEYWERMFAE